MPNVRRPTATANAPRKTNAARPSKSTASPSGSSSSTNSPKPKPAQSRTGARWGNVCSATVSCCTHPYREVYSEVTTRGTALHSEVYDDQRCAALTNNAARYVVARHDRVSAAEFTKRLSSLALSHFDAHLLLEESPGWPKRPFLILHLRDITGEENHSPTPDFSSPGARKTLSSPLKATSVSQPLWNPNQ